MEYQVKQKRIPSDSFRSAYEKLLFWATVLLCEFHMLLCTYRYIVWDYLPLQRIDKWLGVLLVLCFIGYFVYIAACSPDTVRRMKTVLGRMRTFEYGFLFFLPFWYVLSCVLRQITTGNPSIKDNNWWIYITFLTSFFLFPLAGFAGAKRAKEVIDPMVKVILIPNLVFTVWVLWKYFHLDYITFPSGSALAMSADFGLSIGENRLHTANRALTMLCLCLYLVAAECSWRKIPYTVGIPVFFSTVALTNNRGAWYASLLLFAVLAFILTWHRLEKQKLLIRLGISFLCAVVCITCLHWCREGLFHGLDLAIQAKEPITAVPASVQLGIEPVLLGAQKTAEMPYSSPALLAAEGHARTYESGLSSRIPIYKESILYMFSSWYHFLFGATHADVGTELFQAGRLRQIYPSAHNFFMQMGVAFGVPVMIASIVFVIMLLVRCWRVLFRNKEMFPGARMIALTLIPLLAADMVDTTLTAGSSLPCAIFYLFAGWVVAMDLELKKQRSGINN